DILARLMRILHNLTSIASEPRHWRAKGRSHRHGTSASRRHSHERRETAGRRTLLVQQKVSTWQLSIVVCVLLVLIWIGWGIVAQTAARSLAKSHPDAALGFVANQPVALMQLTQQQLAESGGDLDSAREWAQRALRSSPLNSHALALLGLIAER